MSLMKSILGSIVAAAVVTIACLFLPFVGNVASEHPVVFFGAVLLVLVPVNIVRQSRSRKMLASGSEREQRKKECEDWWEKSSQATSCPSNRHDLRNIYRRLHAYDGGDD